VILALFWSKKQKERKFSSFCFLALVSKAKIMLEIVADLALHFI
jgi:hypothetical protein